MNTQKKTTLRSLVFAALALFVFMTATKADAADRKLSFAVSGVVQSIQVKHGVSVKAGTILAVLDQAPFIAKKGAADAAEKSAKLILDLAEVKAQQTRELFDALSTSQEVVDEAETALANAQSGYEAARAKAEIASWELSRSALTAPFAGTVSAIPGYPGMVINMNAGTPTVVIINAR